MGPKISAGGATGDGQLAVPANAFVREDGVITAPPAPPSAAPLASPAFTGTPTAPTASPLTGDTQVATTAYADAAVLVETTRAEAAEALLAPLAGTLQKVATTGNAGFALQNGTPNIISWTAPSDGNMHRVLFIGGVRVTSTQTGGQVNVGFTDPGGTTGAKAVIAGTNAAGFVEPNAGGTVFLIQAGSTITVLQGNALTGGNGTLWAELWAV